MRKSIKKLRMQYSHAERFRDAEILSMRDAYTSTHIHHIDHKYTHHIYTHHGTSCKEESEYVEGVSLRVAKEAIPPAQ